MCAKLIGLLAIASLGWAAFAQNTSPQPQDNQPAVPANSAAPTRKDVVVVTGQYEAIPLEEADRPVSVWDVSKNRLLGASVADFLKLDPSVDLSQRAPDAIQSDLSIRGSTFAQTLVLLNGLRLNDPQSNHHNMDLPLPFASLDRIEVLHGTGSSLYGSDAIGGVVNFITVPAETTEVRLRGSAGNFGVNQQSGAISLVHRNLSEQIGFSRDFSSGFVADRDYRNLSFGSITDWSSRLGASNLTLAYMDRPFGAAGFYCGCDSWERTKGWFASGRQELGRNTEVSFAYRRHSDLFVLYRDQPEVSTNRHISESFQGAVRRRHELGSTLRVYYGAEGFGDGVTSNNLGNHSRIRTAVYAALDARALRRYSFSLAFREEMFRNFQREFIPNLGFGAWLTSQLKVRANVSKGFRLPNYTELYYHDPASVGNPDLHAESAWNYEAGLDLFSGRRVRGAITAFHRRETNGIDWLRPAGAPRWQATNFESLRFTGVEASVTGRLRRSQELGLAWTGIHGSQDLSPGADSRYVFNYPSNTAVLSWTGPLPAGFVGRSRVAVVERYQQDAYVVCDAYLARSKGAFRPFFELTNLTGESYQEIAGIPMPGRGIVAGVELVFDQIR